MIPVKISYSFLPSRSDIDGANHEETIVSNRISNAMFSYFLNGYLTEADEKRFKYYSGGNSWYMYIRNSVFLDRVEKPRWWKKKWYAEELSGSNFSGLTTIFARASRGSKDVVGRI